MKKCILVLPLLLLFQSALPCSTFFIHHNGQMVFGRNYDWVAGTGMVCTNQRGLFKTSFKVPDGNPITWTSRYGSLTFNQYGKEFPTGGMNEKGLVVELMWLDDTKYPEADNRPAIGVLQWIQYQLDNCASINEIIATDKLLRITATTTPLHYLVADATGNAATIEFLQGKMIVHKGNQLAFPVLTNSIYSESVEYAKSTSNQPVEGGGSLERFARACQLIAEYKAGKSNAPLVDQSFNILQSLSQGSFTKWSIVYDITNRRIHFRTNAAPEVKALAFSAFDFACAKAPLFLDMNQRVKGEVSNLFRSMTADVNLGIIRETAEQSQSEINITASSQRLMAGYASSISCK
jgi:penicillin V acylase-like amidase (Ntn superfamily)